MSDITPAMLRDAAQDDEHLALLEAVGLAALLVVPLRTGQEVLGSLALVASQPHRRFDEADLEVADALARRVADALRNDRLFRDRVEMARVLSAGLRPEASPALPGCEVAAVYRPAGEDVAAGGDFYEVIDAPSGSIVVMGDVVGKGSPAAALSAISRVTLRTAGRLTGDPRAALDELNHTLRRRGAMSLCTVVAVALPSELPGSAEVLLAGHPPPLLLRDGVARRSVQLRADARRRRGRRVDRARRRARPRRRARALHGRRARHGAPGRRALRRGAPARAGRGRGRRRRRARRGVRGGARRRCGCATTSRCSPSAARAAGAARPRHARGRRGADARDRHPRRPAAPRAARHALSTAVGARLSTHALADALIIVSELATNAIRHGGAPTEDDELTLHAAILPGGLRLEVSDPGPGFEPGGHGPRPDGGYGLQLLDRLATRWGVAGSAPVTVWVELDR